MSHPGLGCAALLLALGTAPGAACAETGGDPAAALPFQASLWLEHADGRRGGSFAAGEAVVLVLRLHNGTDAPGRVPLSTAQTHDFSVAGPDGREIWRWSEGRRFAQMLGELVLAPGEERLLRAAWTPPADPRAGPYRAVAWVGGPAAGLRAAAVEFRLD